MNDEIMALDIRVGIIKGALEIAPKDDVRYYLNGVYIDPPRGLVEATDGHALFVAALNDATAVAAKFADWPAFIIPREVAAAAAKGKGCVVTIYRDSFGAYTITTAAGPLAFTPIDGRWPDTARIVPAKCSGEIAQFNPELLADCQNALRLAAGAKASAKFPVFLNHNGQGAALMTAGQCDALCVVMPWREDTAAAIDWYRPAPPAASVAA